MRARSRSRTIHAHKTLAKPVFAGLLAMSLLGAVVLSGRCFQLPELRRRQ